MIPVNIATSSKRHGRSGRRAGRMLLLLALALAVLTQESPNCLLPSPGARARAAEAGMHNTYQKVRFRLFRHNRFLSEIIADTANATQLDQKDPRVKMTGVTIEIYDTAASGAGDRPPLKSRITSKEGTYMRAQDPQTKEMQEIAILTGDVVVSRYLPVTRPGAKPELESTVRCDEAKWNNSTGILNGTGNVVMVREDGTLRLTGIGMIYEIDKNKQNQVDLDNKADEMGGKLELQSSVRMEILQRLPDGKPDKKSLTVVTSRGPGRYDLDKREMRFSKEVTVQRSTMQILCDKLQVLLAPKDDTTQRFREMLAESTPTGMVDIRGRGNPNDPAGRGIGEWQAKARYARYQEEAGELLLTDDRENFLPLAQMDNNIIRNTTILFYIKEERLYATGKNGETILNSETGATGPAGASALPDSSGTVKKDQKDEKIVIRYNDKLIFDKKNSVAQFTGNVRLTSSGLQMDSEKLVVDFIPSAKSGQPGQPDAAEAANVDAGRVRKVTASDNVRLLYQQRKARCATLEITPNLDRTAAADSNGYLLVDQFVMSGTPLPEIEIPGGGYFQSRLITTTRLRRLTSDKKIVLINATGPGSGLFGGSNDSNRNPTVPVAEATTIRYSDSMLYNELKDTVEFMGEVTATKGDQVLRSDRLIAMLVAVAGSADQDRKEIKRLIAIGNANMHWGLHHCEADSIDRVIPVDGAKANDIVILTGKPERTAKIWEENGASFQGLNIRAAADGTWVRSQGGGELTMVDRDSREPAIVMYSGEAYYAVQPNTDSYAIFTRNVIMKRGGMTVTGDRMRADMVLVKNAAAPADGSPDMAALSAAGTSSASLPRKLRRVVVDGNVIIRQGKRTATGSRGQVDVNDDGDTMLLEGAPRQRVEINDHNGFQLFAPRVMVKETAGIVSATGPGEVRITGKNSAREAALDTTALGSVGGRDLYVVTYGGKLLYNTLSRKIRFEDNVRMVQDTISGTCQAMTIYLAKEATEKEGEEAQMKVESADATGNVRFIRLPEAPAGRDPYNLPGITILTRSDEVHYDAVSGMIVMNNVRPNTVPATLQQIKMGDVNQRNLQKGERIWVNSRTGAIQTSKEQHSEESVSSDGPLRFPDER